jgi:hypothetical protein
MEAQKTPCGTISGSRRSAAGIVAGGLTVVHHTRPWRNVAEPRTPERSTVQRVLFPSIDEFYGSIESGESCVCGYTSSKHWHVTRHKRTCAVACAHAKNNSKRDAQTQTESLAPALALALVPEIAPAPVPAFAPALAPAPACNGGCLARTSIGIAGAADGAVLCPLDDGLSFFCKDDLKRHLCEAHPAFLEFLKEMVFPQKETLAEDMGL